MDIIYFACAASPLRTSVRISNYCCRASARQHTILDVLRILQSSLDPVFCADLCIVEKSIRVGWMSIFRRKRSSFRSFFKLGGVNKIFLIVCARMSFHNPCAIVLKILQVRGYLYECKRSKFFL